MSSKTTARKTVVVKKGYSSGSLVYNYNVLSVNCEQDWKVSGHCSIFVVSSKNNLLRNHDNASYSLF